MHFKKLTNIPITPQICRVVNISYSSLLIITINSIIKFKNIHRKKKRIFFIGYIPIILRSNKFDYNILKMLSKTLQSI